MTSAAKGKRKKVVIVASDGSGKSGLQLSRSILELFGVSDVVLRPHPKVTRVERIQQIVREAHSLGASVVYTFRSRSHRDLMNDMTMEHGIAAVDLSGPIIDMFSKWLHAEPTHKPSHEESDRRFHARDFLDKHEDGQNPEGLPDADAIIVGPSRTMKTPTCRELASVHFMLVANVPLTTTELPLQLFLVPKHKVFVFVMSSAERLARYRTKRGQNGRLGSQYLDVNLIAQELNRARRLAEKNGWTIIDVAGQAPEELATEIIEILQSRNGCSE